MSLKTITDHLIADPDFQSPAILKSYCALVLADIERSGDVNNRHVLRAMAWLPDRARAFVLKTVAEGAEALKRDGKLKIKKSAELILTRQLPRFIEAREREASTVYRLLDLPDPVEKRREMEARHRERKAREIMRKDSATFSSTFAKSNARTMVQGGAPGLKR